MIMSIIKPITDTALEVLPVDSPTMPAQSFVEVMAPLPLVRPNVIVSLLNYQILLIPFVLVYFMLLWPLFIAFMSLHQIERLSVIHFGIMLWLRNLLLYIRLIHEI